MRKFFIKIEGNSAQLLPEDVMHMTKVLRMQVEEKFIGFCGDEFEYLCKIKKIVKNQVEIVILEKTICLANPKNELFVFQGIAKGEKNQLITQKLTELGASEIIFFESEYAVAHLKNQEKLEKLEKISKESCKQCGRSKPLKISAIKFAEIPNFIINFDLILFLYEKADEANLISYNIKEIIDAKKIAVIVGAEGGFSTEEMQLISNMKNSSNIKFVSLGHRILRTETASIAMCAFLSFIKNT